MWKLRSPRHAPRQRFLIGAGLPVLTAGQQGHEQKGQETGGAVHGPHPSVQGGEPARL